MSKNLHGGGSNTNKNGLTFEQETNLKDLLNSFNYTVDKSGFVFHNNKKIGQLVEKHNLYTNLLNPNNINYKDIISKQLLPDEAFYNFSENKVYILEKKFQSGAGSVDEKLQTCDFKKKQYSKLLKPLNLDVEYIYILSEWFQKDTYSDVLDYIKSVDCDYHFKTIPLNALGL